MNFKYSAVDKAGRLRNGLIEAEGESTARTEIRNKGLYLVSLKEMTGGEKGRRKLYFSLGVKQRLPVMLARQLASLLKGGVPLFQALTIITNQVDGEREKAILGYLRDEVKGGSSLSEALKAYPGIFDNLFVYSVAAGEKTGALDSILNYQANLLESRASVRGKIRNALIYPIIMIMVGAGVLMFLIGYVVPMVTKVFERMNQQLPLPTRLLLAVTHFANSYLLIIAACLALLIFGFSRWINRSPRGRQIWDRTALHFPALGSLYQMILVSRFAKIMGTLLKSGVHMLQSLVVVSSTTRNTIISDAIIKMSKMVERGTDLSMALRETAVFPPYVADMVSVGESSGNLEEMLESVSEYYETNANQRIAAFTSMVEPLIIVFLGAVVGFIMVSIMLPLFEMNRLLSHG
jgi:general secretion pathway protein F